MLDSTPFLRDLFPLIKPSILDISFLQVDQTDGDGSQAHVAQLASGWMADNADTGRFVDRRRCWLTLWRGEPVTRLTGTREREEAGTYRSRPPTVFTPGTHHHRPGGPGGQRDDPVWSGALQCCREDAMGDLF